MSRRQIVSDFFGRPQHLSYFRQGPNRTRRFTAFHLTEFPDETNDCEADDDALAGDDMDEIVARLSTYRQVLLERARLTDKQRAIAEEVINKGRSLHELAIELDVSVEALRQRIEGTRGQGGICKKAPVLYALWLFRNRDRRDISEVLNAIHRAIRSLSAQPVDDACQQEGTD
jgi:predicted DNA-binding protein YlxM (UPF0122 family)